ncbi:MAG: hypothetical protein ABRQ27_15665 [Clostridiaceae bacterium]
MKRKILAGIIAVAVMAVIAIAVYLQKTKQPTPDTSQPVINEISNTDSLNTASAETNESATTINDSDSDTDKSSINIISEENENCVLHLGLTREALKSELSKLKIPILKEYQGKDDYNNYSGVWIVNTENFQFVFNTNNQLNLVFVKGDLPTVKGLKRGDPIIKIHELYGNESYFDRNWDAYVYRMKKCIFGVRYDVFSKDNKIYEWFISQAE